MTKKQKRELKRILAALLLFAMGMLTDGTVGMSLLFLCYALIGWDVLYRAASNILHGSVFDEHFLMSVATIGAMILGEYSEGVAVMLFYQVGEWFQSYAVNQSRRSISDLMDIRPDYANVIRNGRAEEVFPDEVEVGESILVKPGERIPLDGIILEGTSSLDTSALTGESRPRTVMQGSEVISGCINETGVLTIQTTKPYGESTVEKILALVEESTDKKAQTEAFITRFARYYTPVVTIGAFLLAVLPPLIFGEPFGPWVYRALTFLVISCPCALVISVPLSFFGGIGGASRSGILVKGSNYLEVLAKVDAVVFDKTGTLTKGNFSVASVRTASGGLSERELLHYAAHAEAYSSHPIAESVRKAYAKRYAPVATDLVQDVKEIAGQGISAQVEGHRVLAGNEKLMQTKEIGIPEEKRELGGGTVIHLAVDGRYAGAIVIEDELKADAAEAIQGLQRAGVSQTIMLTGDREGIASYVAQRLGLSGFFAELLPQDKVAKVEELLKALPKDKSLAFVGDGINDAPVLARADVGIAMGGLGSDAAIEAADIVLMTDEPSKIVTAIRIAKRTMGIARQNIVFAIGVKLIVLILGALGMATLWGAVFADVGVAVLAILNAMRALRVTEARQTGSAAVALGKAAVGAEG